MDQLLVDHRDIVVSGTVSNQGHFYDRFEHVVLLSDPVEVLLDRVATRSNDPYGREADQRTEIVGHVATVRPLLVAGRPSSWTPAYRRPNSSTSFRGS